jgi:hypothetical protein
MRHPAVFDMAPRLNHLEPADLPQGGCREMAESLGFLPMREMDSNYWSL